MEREDIQHLVMSRSWQNFLSPAIEKRRQELTLILLDPMREKRQNYANDDFIRGAISALTWVARLPSNRLRQMSQEPVVPTAEYPELDSADPSSEE